MENNATLLLPVEHDYRVYMVNGWNAVMRAKSCELAIARAKISAAQCVATRYPFRSPEWLQSVTVDAVHHVCCPEGKAVPRG